MLNFFHYLLYKFVSNAAGTKDVATVVIPLNLTDSVVIPLEATWVRKERAGFTL